MTSPPKKVSPRRERAKGKAGSNSSPTNPVSYVVGIGASAGGLEALERFFKATPSNTGMAFVVIQHLSPDFKSLMDELLARFTQMRLVRVQGPTPVEADTIYLIPPRKEMILEEGLLVLVDRVPDQQLHMPINRFFRSLAREKHEKAIAIVLSGTGSDGSLGLMDVHDSGGLVLVQSEQTAKFDGMPRSAVATGFADSVAAPEEMPALLMRYILNPARPLPQTAARAEGGMGVILERLREGYGIDFSLYKPATITRRIERRLALAQVSTIEEYCQTILREPLELDALYRDLLIGVTRFFRDPEAFEVLREKVAPGLVEGIGPAEDLRVWIPGCATGEEAYSIGMMLLKEFDRRQRPANLKIFATDVHRDSLRIAAEGIYPEAAMESVPADLREEFFSREPDGRLRVVARLRKAMLFSPQNLIKDVPFNRIDFISCRNLLIYFRPSAQTRAITAFHFALTLKGTLLLGPSNRPGSWSGTLKLRTGTGRSSKISETRAPMEGAASGSARPAGHFPAGHGRRHPPDVLTTSCSDTICRRACW
ncbi:MAG: chemotaxis protein CheB [Verrucomicrobiota bacterium]